MMINRLINIMKISLVINFVFNVFDNVELNAKVVLLRQRYIFDPNLVTAVSSRKICSDI